MIRNQQQMHGLPTRPTQKRREAVCMPLFSLSLTRAPTRNFSAVRPYFQFHPLIEQIVTKLLTNTTSLAIL